MSVLSRGASGLTPSATTRCGRRTENRSKRGEKSGSPASVLSRQLRSTRGAVVHQKKNFVVVPAVVSLLSASSCRPAGGPVAWYRCPVLLSGLVVWPCRLLSSSGPVFSFFLKRGDDPGHRPKDPSFGGTTTQGPIFSQVPTSTHGMTVVLVVAAGYLLWPLSLLSVVFPIFARLFKPTDGGRWKNLPCRAGSPWRLFVFLVFFSWCSRSSSHVVYADVSFDVLLCCPSE